MTRVILESPLSAPTPEERAANVRYAVECMRDSLQRGEAPFASHLMYSRNVAEAVFEATLPGGYHSTSLVSAVVAPYGALDDSNPDERKLGMEAGFAWLAAAEKQVVYVDRGVSAGMRAGIARFIEQVTGRTIASFRGPNGLRVGSVCTQVLFRSVRGLYTYEDSAAPASAQIAVCRDCKNEQPSAGLDWAKPCPKCSGHNLYVTHKGADELDRIRDETLALILKEAV